jgi:hypothetical protein
MAVLGRQNGMTLLVTKFSTESSTRQNSIPFTTEQYILSWPVAILELRNLHISVGLVYTDLTITVLYKITVACIVQTIWWLCYELDKAGIWQRCKQPTYVVLMMHGHTNIKRNMSLRPARLWGQTCLQVKGYRSGRGVRLMCHLHLASRIAMRTAVSYVLTALCLIKYKHKFTFTTGPPFLTFILATHLFLAMYSVILSSSYHFHMYANWRLA